MPVYRRLLCRLAILQVAAILNVYVAGKRGAEFCGSCNCNCSWSIEVAPSCQPKKPHHIWNKGNKQKKPQNVRAKGWVTRCHQTKTKIESSREQEVAFKCVDIKPSQCWLNRKIFTQLTLWAGRWGRKMANQLPTDANWKAMDGRWDLFSFTF